MLNQDSNKCKFKVNQILVELVAYLIIKNLRFLQYLATYPKMRRKIYIHHQLDI